MALTPQELITLTNAYRKKQELPPVTFNATLSKAAQQRAEDMAKTGYFSFNY